VFIHFTSFTSLFPPLAFLPPAIPHLTFLPNPTIISSFCISSEVLSTAPASVPLHCLFALNLGRFHFRLTALLSIALFFGQALSSGPVQAYGEVGLPACRPDCSLLTSLTWGTALS
jgi:hypothetical protein